MDRMVRIVNFGISYFVSFRLPDQFGIFEYSRVFIGRRIDFLFKSTMNNSC